MSSSSPQLLVALFLIILSCRTCRATDGDQCSGLCGGQNVSHPFRLQHYPEECGDKRYNLSCEHNQLALYLKSRRYKVLSINYENYTIRVRDANVVEFNYSSLPRDSVTPSNFSEDDPYTTSQRRLDHGNSFRYLTENMIYASCKHAVINSSVLVDTAPYVEASKRSAVSSSSLHLYANVGSQYLGDLGLEDGCGIELVYLTSWPHETEGANHSYRGIHNMLVYGFELSWLNSFCHKSRRYAVLDHRNGPRCIRLDISFIGNIIAFAAQEAGAIVLLITVAKCALGTPIVIGFLIYKCERRHLSVYDNIEDFLQSANNIMPIRYSYKDIKNMTKRFKVKLGKGGYGSVFRGQLRSGRLVAVKMLDKTKTDGQEFINEVASLGRIHHVNVVQLIGYCVEGSKRLLYTSLCKMGLLKNTFILNKKMVTP